MIMNGSTEIAAVYLGETTIKEIYKGNDVIYSSVVRYTVVTDLSNITSDAPSSVEDGGALEVTLTPNTGLVIDDASVVVLMGGVDITSTAYDQDDKTITIAEVTGNVSITADTIYDAEVEYLQGDGAAYINTGIKVANTTSFRFDMYLTTPDLLVQLFGGRTSSSSNKLYALNDSRTSSNIGTWHYGNRAKNFTALSQGRHVFDNTASPLSTLKVDNTSITSTTPITFNNAGEDFYIFTINIGSGSPALNNIGDGVRMYEGKMYSSGNLVRDYIAVRKDGVGYLYDKVSKTLFGNANSSGAFTYGNDKNS